MKLSTSIFLLPPLFIVLGCAPPKYYTQTSTPTAYQEPATAPLTPTGHRDERVYPQPTRQEPTTDENQSPAVIVEPSGTQMTASDLAIGDSIRRTFESDRTLASSVRQMIISVHGGSVKLQGPIGSKYDEQAVLDKLRTIPGVTEIHDELQLRPVAQ